MEQAGDFLKDSRSLYDLMKDRSASDFNQITQFKNWTINDVFGHLYIFNIASIKTLESSLEFDKFFDPILRRLQQGNDFLQAQAPLLEGYTAFEQFEIWWKSCLEVYEKYLNVDPKLRVKWAGPEMSARSSITARQMETWAHGHEIFDCLGISRKEGDCIKNIVHLGVSTFGWAFLNRKLPVPSDMPYISLILPSGELMNYHEENELSFVKGSAVEFCQVVTQTRNVKDTSIRIKGDTARKWMSIAQCFAGKPEDPPEKGHRYRKIYKK